MRDPGTPRRNPFFEHGSDGTRDDFGMGWTDDDAFHDGEGSATEPNPLAAGVGGFATLLALVETLSDAQPDAAEHLVAAAHEVVLTVKVLVDATEAVLAQQREAMATRSAVRSEAAEPTVDTDDADLRIGVVAFDRRDGAV